MQKRDPIRFFICALLLTLVILFEYGESFRFYFFGDDFTYIEFVLQEKAGILWKSPSLWHYYPLGVLLNALPACFGILQPEWFAAVNFLFFLACAISVMVIYRIIAGGLLGGFLAALIFATAVPNSEVMYWKTCTQTAAVAFCSAISLVLFIRYRERQSWLAFLGCIAAYATSMLCIEQGIVTFGIILLYDLIFYMPSEFRAADNGKKTIVIGFLRRYAILLLVPVVLTLIKLAIGRSLSPVPLSARPPGFLLERVLATSVRLVDFNDVVFAIIGSSPAYRVLMLGALLFFLAYFLIRRNAAGLFFLLASHGSLLAISVSVGGLANRYFCLPLMYCACFMSLFFKDIAMAAAKIVEKMPVKRLDSLREKLDISRWVYVIVYGSACLALAFAGLRSNIIRRDYWKLASTIERNIIQAVEYTYVSKLSRTRPGQKIYLLDIPKFIVNEKYGLIYVASNSVMEDIRYRLGKDAERVELIASTYARENIFGKEYLAYKIQGVKNMKRESEIEKLVEEGHLVLRFSPSVMNMVLLVPKE